MFVGTKLVGLLVCVVVVLHGNFVLSQREYCDIASCPPGQHTLCLYPNEEPGSSCQDYVAYPLRKAEQYTIVFNHNRHRSKFAYDRISDYTQKSFLTATNMKQLVWDDELAKSAQRWANQCLDGHDDCRNVPRFSVGQNVLTRPVPVHLVIRQNIDLLLEAHWWDEWIFFDSNAVTSYRPDDRTSNFTQLIWANTSHVGCGASGYTKNNQRYVTLVCNYGTAGNQVGEPVFDIGPVASACPNGTSDYIALCA